MAVKVKLLQSLQHCTVVFEHTVHAQFTMTCRICRSATHEQSTVVNTSSTSLMANHGELSQQTLLCSAFLRTFLQDVINAKIDWNDAAWANQNVF